ncbi:MULTISPECIES: sugar ABC transporter substrate-binding protein [Synechococcus]|uniref:ABC transporter substrate-binding protein n=1 Tax=Synechococcus TaxID=1129 RepID=UPI0009C51CCE|nr:MULTISPECIES: sugar ABC transporter substrate-binding protein [Synechococcus]MCF8133967.1 sugar ABC transporter substrate-binding protein [Synechococcus lacustris]MCP9813799.1 sugar ABC transporter substrate-binding protein [Synechococcus lacustris L1E-Slac]MCP9925275.1 sugar ABC transporter substrate-binding protein [Synechococcus lacustris C3-12m-Tous]OON11853.1 MAG: ABC transporter substrate-binding protein [Synechococcus lacustris str. Tous]
MSVNSPRTTPKVAIKLLLSLAIFLALGGCRGPQKNPELQLWTIQLSPKFDPLIKAMLLDWETKHPGVKVRWTDLPFGSVERKVLAAVFARTAPDVVNLNPLFAANLASKGGLLPLQDRLGPAKATYLPQILRAGEQQGELYALPWYLTARITLANRQLLQQAGYNKPPRRWEEVPAYAERIKQRTGKYALFVTVVPDGSAELLESMVQMGVELVDSRHRARFNSGPGRRAFALWTDLYRRGLLPREVVSQGFQRAIELYQSGELAQVASGAEFLNTIQTNAPRVAAATEPFPPLVGADGAANVAVMNLAVSRQTSRPKEAVDLALFLTNPANQLRFARAAKVLPSSQPALKAIEAELALASRSGVKADLVQRARLLSAQTLSHAKVLVPADPGVKRLQAIIYGQLQRAMLGELSSAAALAAAEKEWNAYAVARWP